ncbi:hypothetical protein [Actinomadura formosensis]|uniref:hypothetical protein n=1 Tax=Actinomadura formosensis TaxID=60706 RepID=UPI0010416164|nr:hypothetical protein [Actinomadura formosensis]
MPTPGQVRVNVVAAEDRLTTVSWMRPAVQSCVTTADWATAVWAGTAACAGTADAEARTVIKATAAPDRGDGGMTGTLL